MRRSVAEPLVVAMKAALRSSGPVPPELIGRIAPTRTEGLNMRGIFRFPIEKYAEALLPSWSASKIRILGP